MFRWSLSILLAAVSMNLAYAAELVVHDENPVPSKDRGTACQLELKGEISTGDADKLARFMSEHELLLSGSPYLYGQVGDGYDLCLNSLGGSYAEALKLVDVISDQKIGTRVAGDAECASACAIAFLAGTFFLDGDYPLRVLEPPGRLGFHAPSIDLPGTSEIPSTMVKVAYEAALNDISGVINRLAVQTAWGTEPRMHPALLQKMMSTPPQSMSYLTTLNELLLWKINLPVFPGDSANLSEANLVQACENQTSWIDGFFATSANSLIDSGELIRVKPVQDARATNSETAFQIELDGFHYRDCVFFIPRGLDRIRDGDIRVAVSSERSGNEALNQLNVVHFLNPEMTLEELKERRSR